MAASTVLPLSLAASVALRADATAQCSSAATGAAALPAWAAHRSEYTIHSATAHHLAWQGQGRHGSASVRSRAFEAFEVSGPGAIDSPMMETMRSKIRAALETEDVVVKDINGDGQHVSIDVVSQQFEGKRSVERQRMVYKAIWEELQGAVHAVDAMTTKTPSEV